MQVLRTYKYILLVIFISCQSQEPTFENIDFENRYLFSAEIENKVEKDTTSWKYQMAATDYATKGDYKAALKKWDIQFSGEKKTFTKKQIDSVNTKYRKVSAEDYIVEQSRKNQVVIINEAHHSSLHRVFTRSLLRRLFDKGYKNLGLEGLGNGQYLDSLLNERGYPNHDTGWYTKEPQFGDLIRTALEIGYHVFPYEETSGVSGKAREIEQAKNIKEVMDRRPNDKFLIHCGFGHVLEGEYKSWEKTMAGRLTEYTKLNPLTITQTAFSEKSDSKYNDPFLKAVDIKQSSILLDQEDNPFRYEREKSWADLVVFHPNTTYTEGRPHWLFKNGKKKVNIPIERVEIEFPVMIQAFKKVEDINKAVPKDILEVNNKNDKAVLALEKGSYLIVLISINKAAIKFPIDVE